MPWIAPVDLVEGDLTGLVEALSDLEPTPDESYDCTFQGGRVRANDLGVLVRDITQNEEPLSSTVDGLGCPGGRKTLYSQVLVGRTAGGDLIAMYGHCAEFYLPAPRLHPVDEPLAWHPSPRSQRILDDLRR